jgi:hypothetical protein
MKPSAVLLFLSILTMWLPTAGPSPYFKPHRHSLDAAHAGAPVARPIQHPFRRTPLRRHAVAATRDLLVLMAAMTADAGKHVLIARAADIHPRPPDLATSPAT